VVAPAAGKVGNLIVAVGLGGKLMRTVSFLGWTLAASPRGLGGTGDNGAFGFGVGSAIKFYVCKNLGFRFGSVKLLIPKCRRAGENAGPLYTTCGARISAATVHRPGHPDSRRCGERVLPGDGRY
jgi:hypothetical protein